MFVTFEEIQNFIRRLLMLVAFEEIQDFIRRLLMFVTCEVIQDFNILLGNCLCLYL